MEYAMFIDEYGNVNIICRDTVDETDVWRPYAKTIESTSIATRMIKLLNEDEERRMAELSPGADDLTPEVAREKGYVN